MIDHGNNYYKKLHYNGTTFIVDKISENRYLVTETNFMCRGIGDTLEEAATEAYNNWDSI